MVNCKLLHLLKLFCKSLLTQKLIITTCKYSVMIKFLVFFCSFGIAYDFIDCVGDDVDVVSDSEVCRAFENLTFLFFLSQNHAHASNVNSVFCLMQNIKKLLKIPYSKSHVSMAVHRVGRTLLLDELDIQELFMSSSQVQQGYFRLLI